LFLFLIEICAIVDGDVGDMAPIVEERNRAVFDNLLSGELGLEQSQLHVTKCSSIIAGLGSRTLLCSDRTLVLVVSDLSVSASFSSDSTTAACSARHR